MNEKEFKRIFVREQIHSDNRLTDFRRYYEELPVEERTKARAWLEKLQAFEKEGFGLGLLLRINMQCEECDEEGETIDFTDCTAPPSAMLRAIEAWDKGEPFTPNAGWFR